MSPVVLSIVIKSLSDVISISPGFAIAPPVPDEPFDVYTLKLLIEDTTLTALMSIFTYCVGNIEMLSGTFVYV